MPYGIVLYTRVKPVGAYGVTVKAKRRVTEQIDIIVRQMISETMLHSLGTGGGGGKKKSINITRARLYHIYKKK